MRWDLEWGPHIETLLEVAKDGPMPDALARRPELAEHERLYLMVFGELTHSRPQGEAFGRIPVSEWKDYFEMWRIDSLVERERILKAVGAMDETYVTYVLDKRKAELEKMKSAKH